MTNDLRRFANWPPAFALVVGALALSANPAHAGPPFRTDDPEPVEYQHWEVYGFTTGTEVRGDTAGIAAGVEVNYGAAPNLQLHMVAPLAFDSPQGGDTQIGIGDVELGVKYRFLEEDANGWRPQVGVFPLVEIPTGNAHRSLGAGTTRAFFPVWAQKSLGDWTTYGGGGYWINPGAGNRNYWFAGWLLQRKLTNKFTFGGEVFHQTAAARGARDSNGFNVGGFYDFTENHHVLFSVGRGLENADKANRLSYYLGYQYTF
jgi:hypothetical protein